jgi:hypothetical protein
MSARTLLLTAALGTVLAAPVVGQGFSVGARGGLNYTNLSEEAALTEFALQWHTGFHAGASLGFAFHPAVAVQLEGWYTQKGVGLEGLGLDGKFKVAYIELPLLLKARIPTGVPVWPRLMAGGAVAFEASCRVTGQGGGIPIDEPCDDPSIDIERDKTDFGLVLGAGVGGQAGPVVVFLDAMYDLGIANLATAAAAPDESVKNRAWLFSAGLEYGFRIW